MTNSEPLIVKFIAEIKDFNVFIQDVQLQLEMQKQNLIRNLEVLIGVEETTRLIREQSLFIGYGSVPGIGPWADVEAEVKCLHCGAIQWIPYADRQAGAKVPPKGVDAKGSARCEPCHTGEDYTAWTGRTRLKK